MRHPPVLVQATDELAKRMAPRIRMVDCREMREETDPLEMARGSLAASSHAWCWLIDGEPACMFGVAPKSILGGEAYVWLLATDAIKCDRRTFWLGSQIMLDHLLSLYPKLEGYVDARFSESVRWIRRLGFRVKPMRIIRGVPFHHFEVSRHG